jgi:hypothetical protein
MRLALALVLATAVTARPGCDAASAPAPAPYDACAGKACGSSCTVCAPDAKDCVETAELKACDATGACVPGDGGPCEPHPDCVGKACGAECNPCGPERVCPTLIPSACDRLGRCAGDVPGICDEPRGETR